MFFFIKLKQRICPVWYDEFSLPVGSKLRESIENGIKISKKCILIITKNFINNNGWTKVEFDSIFTKEIIKKDNVVLPIWYDITREEVYEYSSWLANITALYWDDGENKVINELYKEIMK